MKKLMTTAAVLVALVAPANARSSADWRPGDAGFFCSVNDPTGTPLNVRAQPNGEIIGTIPNGEEFVELLYEPVSNEVEIKSKSIVERGDKNIKRILSQKWVYIISPRRGWVIRQYLENCNYEIKA